MNVITLFIATLISAILVLVPGQQDCQTKERYATVDANFTVYFQPCHGLDSCTRLQSDCELPDERIYGAGIYPHSSGPVSWNTTSFKVEFTKGDLVNGSHRYELWYEYLCTTTGEFCTNSGMHLHLKIARFQLESSNVIVGGNTTFHCSSGLETANNITVNFTFTSKEGNTTNVSCDPNQRRPKRYNQWIISRNPNKPHDCSLEVIDVSPIDSGTYQCVGLLPTDNRDVYENAYSNVKKIDLEPDRTILPTSVTDSEPDWTIHPASVVTDDTPLGPSTSLLSIYAVGIASVLIAIMVVIAIIGWLVKKQRKERLPPDPEHVPLLFGEGTYTHAERRQSRPPSSNDDRSTEGSSTSLHVTPPGSNSSDEPVVFAMDNSESSGEHDQHRDVQVEVHNELRRSSRAGSIESEGPTIMAYSSDGGRLHSTLATTPHFSESEEPRLKIKRASLTQDDSLVSVGRSTKRMSLPHIPKADLSTQNPVQSGSEGEISGVSDDKTRQNDLQSSKSETESDEVLSVPSDITGIPSGQSETESDKVPSVSSDITGIPSGQSDSSNNSKRDDESRPVSQDDLGSFSMFSESTKSTHSNVESSGSEEGEKRTENPLLKGIEDDERSAAQGVLDQGQLLKETPVVEGAPIDENLICPYCKRGYKMGQICYFARHVNKECPKAPKSGVSLSPSPQGLPTGVPGGTASDVAESPSSLDCQFCGEGYQINHFKKFAIHVRSHK